MPAVLGAQSALLTEATGTIKTHFATTAPSGWHLMNGDTIGDTGSGATHTGSEYSALFEIVKLWAPNAGSEVFASGDTVILTDVTGKIPIGYDSGDSDFNQIGKVGGDKTKAYTHSHVISGSTNDPGDHNHTGVTGANNINSATDTGAGRVYADDGHTHTIGNDGAHTHTLPNTDNDSTLATADVMNPFFTVNWIVKI